MHGSWGLCFSKDKLYKNLYKDLYKNQGISTPRNSWVFSIKNTVFEFAANSVALLYVLLVKQYIFLSMCYFQFVAFIVLRKEYLRNIIHLIMYSHNNKAFTAGVIFSKIIDRAIYNQICQTNRMEDPLKVTASAAVEMSGLITRGTRPTAQAIILLKMCTTICTVAIHWILIRW